MTGKLCASLASGLLSQTSIKHKISIVDNWLSIRLQQCPKPLSAISTLSDVENCL